MKAGGVGSKVVCSRGLEGGEERPRSEGGGVGLALDQLPCRRSRRGPRLRRSASEEGVGLLGGRAVSGWENMRCGGAVSPEPTPSSPRRPRRQGSGSFERLAAVEGRLELLEAFVGERFSRWTVLGEDIGAEGSFSGRVRSVAPRRLAVGAPLRGGHVLRRMRVMLWSVLTCSRRPSRRRRCLPYASRPA